MSGQIFSWKYMYTGVFENFLNFSFDLGAANLKRFGVVGHSGYKCD